MAKRNNVKRLHPTSGGLFVVDPNLASITFEAFNTATLRKGSTIPDRLHYRRVNQQRRVREIESRPGHALTCVRRIKRANARLRKAYETGKLKPKHLASVAAHIEADLAMVTHEALMRTKAINEAEVAKARNASKDEVRRIKINLDFEHIFPKEEWREMYLDQLQHIFPGFCRPLQAILIERLQKE